MEQLYHRLRGSLERRKDEGTLRKLQIGGSGMDFSSNDYLGLARSRELASRIEAAYSQLLPANGSGGSRLIAGHSHLAASLEEELAQFFQAESSLLFNSGYTANLALLSSLPKKGDTILYDELSHASIKEGLRLSPARRFAFRHNSLESLAQRLRRSEGQVFVLVESVYSMDGDQAPLQEIAVLCREAGAALIVDEAHSTGIYSKGRGLVCALGLEEEVFARVHTFGKAIGIHGACVAGAAVLKEYLLNFARSFIYTTAMPPHSLVSIQQAFYLLEVQPERLNQLHARVSLFRKLKEEHLMPLLEPACQIDSPTPVQALVVPGVARLRKLAHLVQQQGYNARPIFAPTVPEGKERLRICLHSFNTEEEIEGLVQTLAQGLK